ncbi:hypothetical protein EHU38_14875, partial [Escherichia coli]|uniref:hypothetical protein n=1 Tax=Escherichia coli TaxID=562 RepID=UPI001BDB701D
VEFFPHPPLKQLIKREHQANKVTISIVFIKYKLPIFNLIITIILLMQIYVKRGIKKTPRNITQTNH